MRDLAFLSEDTKAGHRRPAAIKIYTYPGEPQGPLATFLRLLSSYLRTLGRLSTHWTEWTSARDTRSMHHSEFIKFSMRWRLTPLPSFQQLCQEFFVCFFWIFPSIETRYHVKEIVVNMFNNQVMKRTASHRNLRVLLRLFALRRQDTSLNARAMVKVELLDKLNSSRIDFLRNFFDRIKP